MSYWLLCRADVRCCRDGGDLGRVGWGKERRRGDREEGGYITSRPYSKHRSSYSETLNTWQKLSQVRNQSAESKCGSDVRDLAGATKTRRGVGVRADDGDETHTNHCKCVQRQACRPFKGLAQGPTRSPLFSAQRKQTLLGRIRNRLLSAVTETDSFRPCHSLDPGRPE